jgi:single-stranded DNA-binding protein
VDEKVREITWVTKHPTPELKYTPNGKLYYRFGAKVHGNYHSVTYWPTTEEEGAYLAETLVEGAMVAIVGKASERTFTGNDGTQKTGFDVKAYHVGVMYGAPYEERSAS